MQARRPLQIELAPILGQTDIWFIHGNHDTDFEADHDHLFGSAMAERNLHGRVVEIAGLRIAGLGGVFRGKVWFPPAPAIFDNPAQYLAHCGKGKFWHGGSPLTQRSTIFPVDYARLMGQQADILVMHEALGAHPHGFSAIDELACRLGVSTSFHGHHHDRLDYRGERTRFDFDTFGVACAGSPTKTVESFVRVSSMMRRRTAASEGSHEAMWHQLNKPSLPRLAGIHGNTGWCVAFF